MEDLFRDYWWLIFPIFGMAMRFSATLPQRAPHRARAWS